MLLQPDVLTCLALSPQVIPPGLDARFCGHVYLISFVDNINAVAEIFENNNQIALPIFVKCYQGD